MTCKLTRLAHRAAHVAALSAALALACADRDPGAASFASGCQNDSPFDCDEAVWSESSVQLRASWFSFWDGGFRVALDRDELSPEQIELLSSLRTGYRDDGCAYDVAESALTVVDADGSEARYYAIAGDGICNPAESVPFVSYEVWGDFVENLGCLPAKGYDGRQLGAAATVRADSGCEHGLFHGFDEARSYWFRLEVDDASAPLLVQTFQCRDRTVALTLLDEAGQRVLAETTGTGRNGGDDRTECPALTHQFEAAGSYVLRIDVAPDAFAGDFYFSVESE